MSSQDSPTTHGWVSRAHHLRFTVPRVPPTSLTQTQFGSATASFSHCDTVQALL